MNEKWQKNNFWDIFSLNEFYNGARETSNSNTLTTSNEWRANGVEKSSSIRKEKNQSNRTTQNNKIHCGTHKQTMHCQDNGYEKRGNGLDALVLLFVLFAKTMYTIIAYYFSLFSCVMFEWWRRRRRRWCDWLLTAFDGCQQNEIFTYGSRKITITTTITLDQTRVCYSAAQGSDGYTWAFPILRFIYLLVVRANNSTATTWYLLMNYLIWFSLARSLSILTFSLLCLPFANAFFFVLNAHKVVDEKRTIRVQWKNGNNKSVESNRKRKSI